METNDGIKYGSQLISYDRILGHMFLNDETMGFDLELSAPNGEKITLTISKSGRTILNVSSEHEGLRQGFLKAGNDLFIKPYAHLFEAGHRAARRNAKNMDWMVEWENDRATGYEMSDDTSEIDKFLDEFVIKEESGGDVSNEPSKD